MELIISSLLLLLPLSALIAQPPTAQADAVLPGTIERTTKQQVLATIPPGTSASHPLLSSLAGKYAAYFVRRETAPGAGGFGNDFCYIQVEDTATGQSVWESECAPASTSNACALVFSDSGLEVFDGSNSAWNTNAESADGNPLQSVELVDEGDMRIRDKEGELAWKASDEPRNNQQCGEPGSPGLAQALPPFAQPIGGSSDQPFGQQQQSGGPGQVQPIPGAGRSGEQQQPVGGVRGTFGFGGQPLVDSTPFDSGSCKGLETRVGWVRAMLLALTGYVGLLLV